MRFVTILIFVLTPVLAHAAGGADNEDPGDGPTWFKKKEKAKKEKAAEEKKKAAEKPVISGDQETTFSQLSSASPKPLPPHLLFKSAGLTDSFSLDYGYLAQSDVNGLLLSTSYAMGWWWTPDLTLSGFVRVNGLLQDTYLWVMLSIGPQIRYFVTHNWALTGAVGWGVDKGLSRVNASHIPGPPDATLLAARNGPLASVQAAYLFWSKRDLAIGPALNFEIGKQGDRTESIISLGITFQSGRPDYTGDLTQ